jgi:hypothetical protein
MMAAGVIGHDMKSLHGMFFVRPFSIHGLASPLYKAFEVARDAISYSNPVTNDILTAELIAHSGRSGLA